MIIGLSNSLIAFKAAFGCLLLVIVVRMAIIDCREMILPNRLNFLLAASGTGQTFVVGQPNFGDALLGALLGFVVLWGVATLFRHLRGIDGLGFGDQKFSAAAGLWIGWQEIAPMLLIASCSALAFVTIRSAKERSFDVVARVPFGPFLGIGVVACWLFTVVVGS
jgi:leader peptidase (prepilin peptidase)/N-methyltransferase